MTLKKLFFTFLILISNSYLYADMGAIVPVESVKVSEPAQKAIIAHDGFEEILILSTDLKVSKNSKIVRFIPFPSKPNISILNKNCFKNLEKIIKKYNISFVVQYKSALKKNKEFKVEFYKKIGAHEINLLYVENLSKFIKWIEKYFNKLGFRNKKLSEKEISIINKYIKNGFKYFVFDVVSLDKEVKTVSPVLYNFKSRYLYYPLITSNLMSSNGKIILFILSENGDIMLNYPWQKSTTAILNESDMHSIAPNIVKLLGKHSILQVFRYSGKLTFSEDIWIKLNIKETLPYLPKKLFLNR